MFARMKNNLTDQQLSLKEILAYGSGMFALGIGMLGGNYLTYFWTDIALIPLVYVSVILLITRVWDGVNDIFIGWIIDRTETKYGKARPWILWMSVPSIVTCAAMFYVPEISVIGKAFFVAIVYSLNGVVFSTFAMLSMHSMTSLMTPNPQGRLTLSLTSQITSSLANTVGSAIVIAGIAYFGNGKSGYFGFFGTMALITGIMFFLSFLGMKEKVKPVQQKEEKLGLKEALKIFTKNKWWIVATVYQFFTFILFSLTAVNIYYMINIMHDITLMATFMTLLSVTMMFVPLIISPLVKLLKGKVNCSILGSIISIIGGLLPLLNISSVPLLLISSVVRGLGLTLMFGIRFAIMADVADYGEYISGRRMDGMVYSGISMSGKLGMGIGGVFITFLLSRAGYVGGAMTQIPSALSAIIFLFTWIIAITGVFMLISLIALKGLDKQMPQIVSELKLRRGNHADIS